MRGPLAGSVADIADFWDAWGASARRARLRLQLGPDGFEEPEAHRAVIAGERDHEAHTPMLRSVGIARQGPDAGKGAGLEVGAVAAAEQGGMGLEQVQQLGKAVGREAVAAADARASLSWMDSARPCLTSISFATWSDFSRL